MRKFIGWLFEPLYRLLTNYMGDTGLILYGGGKGGGTTQVYNGGSGAPDYTALAASNTHAADLAAQAAQAQLDFQQNTYNDMKPHITQAMDNASTIAQKQATAMDDAKAHADSSWQRWQDVGIPEQDKMVADANNYGSTADQEKQGGMAMADVQQQSDMQQQELQRRQASMGVNPNSGASAALGSRAALETAGMEAGAGTSAMTAARDKGIALRAGAASALSGQPNVAAQQMGLSTASGNSSASNGIAGANSGLNWANFATAGTGNAIAAQGLYTTGNNALMNATSNDYKTSMGTPSMSGVSAGQSGGGGGGILGLVNTGLSIASMFGMADGGAVQGPGTGISDSVPAVNTDTGQRIQLSNGEYVLPADTVRAIGRAKLEALVKKTHTPAHLQRRAMRT